MKKEKDWKTEWQTAQLDAVLRYFANAYTVPDGYEIHSYEAFVDTGKREVAFKLNLKPI